MKRIPLTGIILFLALALALLGLPIAGVAIGGRPIVRYLEFPPLTHDVVHAPFSWPAFIGLALLILAMVLPVVLRVVRSQPGNRLESAAGFHARRFPWWGYAGLALTLVAWVLAWTRFAWFAPAQLFTFSPLWFGFILVVNAWTVRRSGRCMLLDRTAYFLTLFPVSAVFWWFFEYLNRFVQNWYYVGASDLSPQQYVWFATLPFSTVLPAVLGTDDLLSTFPRLTAGLHHAKPFRLQHPRRWAMAWLALGLAGLAGIGTFPNLLYPLLWIAPLVLITATQALRGRPTIFAPIGTGNWQRVIRLALAALICGFFWEMWNVFSAAKWIYAVPYVYRFCLFEMPILGFAGYLPFGLECAVIGDAIWTWLGRNKPERNPNHAAPYP